MKAVISVFLCILSFVNCYTSDRLLRNFPLIMSHDAATSMLDSKLNVIESYTQTQSSGTLASQLDCGARAFDYRPYLMNDGSLVAHHGAIKVKSSMEESVQGLIDWLKVDEHNDELVLLYVSHCEADGDNDTQGERCTDASAQLLEKLGVSVISDCESLSGMTVAEAFKHGELSENSGSLLAVQGCVNENYDSSINCYGFYDKVKTYCCYGKNKEVAWNNFAAYLNRTAASMSTDALWMLQAHWQSDAVSIPLGDLHRSSVLEDESKAGVNAWLASTLRSRALPFESLNIIELDNVCDGGVGVLAALRESWY
jgi:hypothetical protein